MEIIGFKIKIKLKIIGFKGNNTFIFNRVIYDSARLYYLTKYVIYRHQNVRHLLTSKCTSSIDIKGILSVNFDIQLWFEM